ncbi:roadblock/LC7 domain-containing protein [Amycolatopsis thailandensis]|uniref:roadblock/LC7 domain-containing protein n=1 Tax=Amycolatopsis thailandensis TaxID=589330 RepID=UPI00362B60C5
MVDVRVYSTKCSWLIDDFVERAVGVSHGVLLSADGFLLAASASLPADRAKQLAALAGGLAGLARGAARCLELGKVRETIVSMDEGMMVLMALDQDGYFCVLVDSGHDIGQIAYEMTVLVERFGLVLFQGRT